MTPARTVGTDVTVGTESTVILSLGSNLGDRERTLREAVSAIARVPGVSLVAASGIVETPALKPHGVDEEAPAYLNAVIEVATTRDPEDLLAALNDIERESGRVRAERWGDRTLDIDIVVWGSREMHTDRLTVPHPRAFERAFVLAPWLQIDPEASIPGRGRVDQLLSATGETVAIFEAENLAPHLSKDAVAGGAT